MECLYRLIAFSVIGMVIVVVATVGVVVKMQREGRPERRFKRAYRIDPTPIAPETQKEVTRVLSWAQEKMELSATRCTKVTTEIIESLQNSREWDFVEFLEELDILERYGVTFRDDLIKWQDLRVLAKEFGYEV